MAARFRRPWRGAASPHDRRVARSSRRRLGEGIVVAGDDPTSLHFEGPGGGRRPTASASIPGTSDSSARSSRSVIATSPAGSSGQRRVRASASGSTTSAPPSPCSSARVDEADDSVTGRGHTDVLCIGTSGSLPGPDPPEVLVSHGPRRPLPLILTATMLVALVAACGSASPSTSPNPTASPSVAPAVAIGGRNRHADPAPAAATPTSALRRRPRRRHRRGSCPSHHRPAGCPRTA